MKREIFEEILPMPGKSFENIRVDNATQASKEHLEGNQDVILIDRENGVYGVFDGMGGHLAGEVAAGMAKEFVKSHVSQMTDANSAEELEGIIKQIFLGASAEISETAQKDQSRYRGMGTTATLLKLLRNGDKIMAGVGNVGDGRLYHLPNNGSLEQITLDDGAWRSFFKPGQEQEAREFQKKLNSVTRSSELGDTGLYVWNSRNRIIRALGPHQTEVSINFFEIFPGDRLLLVSDGVSDNLTDAEMEEILKEGRGANVLVEKAAERSRNRNHFRAKADDMTAIVIEI